MTDTEHAWFGCPQYCGNDYRGLGEGALTLALLLIMLFTKVALRKLRSDAGKGLEAKSFPHMAERNGGSFGSLSTIIGVGGFLCTRLILTI